MNIDAQTTEQNMREILPRSASIIDAFMEAASRDQSEQLIMETASELAAHHQEQWRAEDAGRAPDASAEDIAASKRLIDELNARRMALVERIDRWVAREVYSPARASLHTETLGSVVDRLAIAWVRSNTLITSDGIGDEVRDRAGVALRQLAELADAYDDLVRDVGAGRRRLPAWRPLKVYRSTP